MIRIGRAIASTFIGKPPTLKHTADHKDRNTTNDTLENIRWLCKSGQIHNQTRSHTLKSAFVVIKDDVEKTINDWLIHLRGHKNHLGRDYTAAMIGHYAKRHQFGFSYKKYHDLPDEIWKCVKDSKNSKNHWEISNMNRMKYVTNHTENVFFGSRLVLNSGYPTITINKKKVMCHILSFKTFFPDEYESMKPDEIILHDNDDKSDFRPHKLRIGTISVNGKDAHDNGKYDGTKNERINCASYINGILEKNHDSQRDAVKYLRTIGFTKADSSGIRKSLEAFRDENVIVRYGRTWQTI
jgi:hypothetical protein